MALICKSGAKECTSCRLCFSATVCEICGKRIPDGRIYYELPGALVCSDCIESIVVEKDTECYYCQDVIEEDSFAHLFGERIICQCCARLAGRKKGYV